MTRRTLGYFNYVLAFLMIAMLVVQCFVPFIHYGVDEAGADQSVSIAKYVITPYEYRDMDKFVKETVDDFTVSSAMLPGAVIPIFAIVGIIYVLKNKTMSAAIYGAIWSGLGLIIYLTSAFCRMSNMFPVHIIILALALAVSVFEIVIYARMPKAVDNDKAEVFEKDPRAASKLKNIEKAIEKKDVHELLDYAVSTDKSIRLKAVDGLGKVGGEGAFNLLVPMLRNADVECRSAAAKALGNLGDARALAFIYDRLNREEDSSVKQILLDSMAQLHGTRAE